MSLKESIRNLIGRIPKWLLIALALAGFWYLSHGFTVGPGTTIGYAEEVIHQIAPLQTARLREVTVVLGQKVKAGDVLARLDDKNLQLKRTRVVAELDQVKANLVAEQDVQASFLMRGQIQAVRAYADVQRMRAELREYSGQLKRLNTLKRDQLVRAAEVEAAQRQKKSLSADLSSRPLGTVRDQELMGLRPRPKTDQDRRLEERLGPFRNAVSVKEAELAELDQQLADLVLKSPVDGTVGTIVLRPGDVVGAGTPILTVVTTRPGHVVAYVPERQVTNFPLGRAIVLRKTGVVVTPHYGTVVELGPLIEEVPIRSRPTPSVPAWGRRIVVKVDKPMELLPGEAFRVTPR
ncbi:MAG TPA: biotin/lipoyl-binding protein [Pseudomonadota bacterium]|nr:biotin/lipoyl-binding protein [Pseudomonadota bacterium]